MHYNSTYLEYHLVRSKRITHTFLYHRTRSSYSTSLYKYNSYRRIQNYTNKALILLQPLHTLSDDSLQPSYLLRVQNRPMGIHCTTTILHTLSDDHYNYLIYYAYKIDQKVFIALPPYYIN